jgi:Flp pilus assembly protein TadG
MLISRAPKRTRCTGDTGVATIEFALVLPIFLVLLLGIVSAGMLWNTRLQMGHATREGARHGAAIPVEQVFDSGTWAENVRQVIVNRSAGDLDAADVCVSLVLEVIPAVWDADNDYTTKADGTPCFDDSDTGDDSLRVQVSAATTRTLETGIWATEVDLDTTATARHEQAPS